MNLATIEMPKAEARARYIEYRDSVRERHNAEEAEIARGFRALARGQQVIDLPATLKAGGADDKGLPRLAAMRATAEWCYLETLNLSGSGCFCGVDPTMISPLNRHDRVYFPAGTMPERQKGHRASRWGWSNDNLRAMVPIVPPSLRPKHSLAGYHVLFEVEKWEHVPAPPGDPALLKHIGGDLYAVLATWDLTALERAVLNRRNR